MFASPGDGTSYWIGNREFVTVKMGRDMSGASAVVEPVALPGAEPPPHIHSSPDETHCLLEGELDVLDGERTFTVRAGSVAYLPKEPLQAWRNATTATVRALHLISPASFEGVAEVLMSRLEVSASLGPGTALAPSL